MTIGLWIFAPPRPSVAASYALRVPQAGDLPTASFRPHLTMIALAVQLTVPVIRVRGGLTPPSECALPGARKKGAGPQRTCPLWLSLEEKLSLFLPLFHVTARAFRWTCWLLGSLCFLVATLTVLMEGILCRKGLPFCLGLMALYAEFAAGLTLLPGVMAFGTIDLQCFRMLFVVECHLSKRRIEGHYIFCCKNTAHHQERK